MGPDSQWSANHVLGAASDDPKHGASFHGQRTKAAGVCADNKPKGCFQIRLWAAVSELATTPAPQSQAPAIHHDCVEIDYRNSSKPGGSTTVAPATGAFQTASARTERNVLTTATMPPLVDGTSCAAPSLRVAAVKLHRE